MKRLLFIGVGCQVQALRSVEKYLGLDKLYVLGTNCVDNGRCVFFCFCRVFMACNAARGMALALVVTI